MSRGAKDVGADELVALYVDLKKADPEAAQLVLDVLRKLLRLRVVRK